MDYTDQISCARAAALFDLCGYVVGTYTISDQTTILKMVVGLSDLPYTLGRFIEAFAKAHGVEQATFERHKRAAFRVVMSRVADQPRFLHAIIPYLQFRKRAAANAIRLREGENLTPRDRALLLDEAMWFNTEEAWKHEKDI